MDTLHQAIAAYQTALDQLPAKKTAALPAQTMQALLARDRLARVVASSAPTPDDLRAITELDSRMRAQATFLDANVGRDTLSSWRASLQPADTAWWWRLDEQAAAAERKPHPLWALTATFFLTISLSITAEVARRFLSVGPDFVGVFSTLFQGLITLLAGRSLTDAGQRSLERILSHININRKYAHIANTILALAVLLIVIGLRLSLPVFARYYNDHGVNLQRSGQITAALQDYQRAVSLTPNYAVAHYNLGTAYEDILAYDLAASSYQTAVRSDNNLYAAYSNLARVYMLHQNNFASALPLLDTALDLPLDLNEEDGRAVRYSMLKNRGWAFLGLTYYILAEADIRQALELYPNGAAAHCLMAQLLEAQNKTKEALPNWEACLRYEKEDVVPVEARWISQARQRLSEEAAP